MYILNVNQKKKKKEKKRTRRFPCAVNIRNREEHFHTFQVRENVPEYFGKQQRLQECVTYDRGNDSPLAKRNLFRNQKNFRAKKRPIDRESVENTFERFRVCWLRKPAVSSNLG